MTPRQSAPSVSVDFLSPAMVDLEAPSLDSASSHRKRVLVDEDDISEVEVTQVSNVDRVAKELKTVRPFVRVVKSKPVSLVHELLSKIVSNQDTYQNRLSPFDKAVSILKDKHSELLDMQKEMDFIGLLADNSSYVNQFLSFTDAQQTLFIKSKLDALEGK